MLKATKVFVTRANSRQEFIDKIRESSFNVAFIDQMLFENDDEIIEELVTNIRQIDSKLPVYIITENAAANEAFYKQKGFYGTLPLPIDCGLFERTIMLHLPREMMEIPDKNTIIEDLKEIPQNLKWLYTVPGLSVEEGIKNSNGIGNYLFGIKLFLDTIDENINCIKTAYKKGDFNVYRVRNGIIGNSARIIGAIKLYELCTNIEYAFKHDDKLFIAANTEKLLDEYGAFKQILSKLNEQPEQEQGAQNV